MIYGKTLRQNSRETVPLMRTYLKIDVLYIKHHTFIIFLNRYKCPLTPKIVVVVCLFV